MRSFILLLLLISLNGCIQIRVSQLDEVYKLFISDNQPLQEHLWRLDVGDYKNFVYFVRVNNQSIFVNRDNDIAILDGFRFTQIHFPTVTHKRFTFNDKGGEPLQIYIDGTLYESQSCKSWMQVELEEMRDTSILKKWRLNKHQLVIHQRICNGITQNTHTTILKNDKIVLVSQYIPYLNKQVTISKLVPR